MIVARANDETFSPTVSTVLNADNVTRLEAKRRGKTMNGKLLLSSLSVDAEERTYLNVVRHDSLLLTVDGKGKGERSWEDLS